MRTPAASSASRSLTLRACFISPSCEAWRCDLTARGAIGFEEELRIVLGVGRVCLNGSDRALETVEIRAPQEVHESPREVSVPFGLAGIVWGVRHPTQAWRLFLPVID